MPELEARYPCPVCLGVRMEKSRVGSRGELVLDSCRRCGGIWFELGEVQRLKRLRPDALWDRVGLRDTRFVSQCHACHAPLDRNAIKCAVCDRSNTIACPVCDRTMDSQTEQGLRLDMCRSCKGVWFDHVELAAIWTLALERTAHLRTQSGRSGAALSGTETGAIVLADALAYSPELVVYGARAAGYAVVVSGEALANAPEAAASLMGGVAEAAASVFEAVLGIIGDMF
jgi:Zn-finger nucleic acid-binding protein